MLQRSGTTPPLRSVHKPKALNVLVITAAATSCLRTQEPSALCTSVENADTFFDPYQLINILWTPVLEHIIQLFFFYILGNQFSKLSSLQSVSLDILADMEHWK